METCIQEFGQTADLLLNQLNLYKLKTMQKLAEVKETLERYIDDAIVAAETTLVQDSPSGMRELVLKLRDTDADELVFQIFDYSLNSAWLQNYKERTLTFKALQTTTNSDSIIGIHGNSVRIFSLSQMAQVAERTIKAKIVAGSVYCPTDNLTVLVLAANPPSSSVYEVDIAMNETAIQPDMAKARAWPGVLLHGVWLYVFGGDTPGLKSCEKFNLATSRWSSLPNMKTPKSAFSPCEHRGEVYLPCVRWEQKALESFSLAKQQFQLLRPKLPFTMVDSVAFHYAGELIVVARKVIQMARWKIGSEEEFRVSGYFKQENSALSKTPLVVKGKLGFFINAENGNLSLFDLETCSLRGL